MKVLVLGSDGYIGAQYIQSTEHECVANDNYVKRTVLESLNVEPLYPVPHPWEVFDGEVKNVNIADTPETIELIDQVKPDAVIHLAEQPSAPYSMRGPDEGIATIENNLFSTMNLIYALREFPEVHLIKLGTMGQYGCPDVPIPEGWFECEYKGRKDKLLFPRTPHSIYHLSKTFDSDALAFACRMWGLRVTDLQQGFVHSTVTDNARFCYDAEFGTVLNRFMIQAIVGHPLTVYGRGGQTRGVLHIRDTIQCLDLAIENIPEAGEYRVINQLTEWKSINQFAQLVKKAGDRMGLAPTIDHIENPRIEKEEHFYEVEHQTLKDYGLKPHLLDTDMICEQMERLMMYKENIHTDYIIPKVKWR